jgi:hypothetical protein
MNNRSSSPKKQRKPNEQIFKDLLDKELVTVEDLETFSLLTEYIKHHKAERMKIRNKS